MPEETSTTAGSEAVEISAETSDGVEVKAAIRFPRGYTSAVSQRSDVEGHEFEEEDPLERMVHVNVGCCT